MGKEVQIAIPSTFENVNGSTEDHTLLLDR